MHFDLQYGALAMDSKTHMEADLVQFSVSLVSSFELSSHHRMFTLARSRNDTTIGILLICLCVVLGLMRVPEMLRWLSFLFVLFLTFFLLCELE